MVALATMPSDKMMTLPAAVTVVVDAGVGALTFAATVRAFGAIAVALTGVVTVGMCGCAEDWAKAGMAIIAQLEIKVSLTRQGFTRVPNGSATNLRDRVMLGRAAAYGRLA